MSITVDAADYDLPYIICVTDNSAGTTEVYVSDGPFVLTAESAGVTSTFATGTRLLSIPSTTTLRLEYSESLGQWVTAELFEAGFTSAVYYRFGASTRYAKNTSYEIILSLVSNDPEAYWLDIDVITNVAWNSAEQAAIGGYSNDLTQLPQGLTESAIQDLIDAQLNTQTAAGETATTIINNTTVQYNSYQAGDITSAEMQSHVSTNLDTLSELTPSTLLDAMQINNAITYNQSIQDQLLNNVSADLQTTLSDRIAAANSAFTSYRSGDTDQAVTISKMRTFTMQIAGLLDNYSSTADVNAINAALDAVNNLIDAVGSYSDVSQEASDKSQASDQAELDYLDELTAETTATVEQLAPSQKFNSSQTGEAQEVLNLIWENDFVKKLLPLCAGFMVVCVVLGIRYKV